MQLLSKNHFNGLVLTLFMCLSSVTIARGQEENYKFNNSNSQVKFTISHLGVLRVNGNFKSFSGKFKLKDNELIEVDCAISVKSIFTDNKERDNIIITAPYLDAENFSEIHFTSTVIYYSDEKKQLEGVLRIKDVERPILFEFDSDIKKDSGIVTFSAETQITRKDFNLVFGSMNGLIGNKINIELKINAIKE